jgi:hypothetical protein
MNHKNIGIFLKALAKLLSLDELKQILLMRSEKHLNNCFAIVSERNTVESIRELFNFLRATLDLDELKELLQQTNIHGENAAQQAKLFNNAEAAEKVAQMIEETLKLHEEMK